MDFPSNNNFVNLQVQYAIDYFDDGVAEAVLTLPDTLAARYLFLTRRMRHAGPNLGMPHTRALGDGLFEMRLKGAEGIARVLYCAVVDRRIVMLHAFVKKSQRIPPRELELARNRLKELNREKP